MSKRSTVLISATGVATTASFLRCFFFDDVVIPSCFILEDSLPLALPLLEVCVVPEEDEDEEESSGADELEDETEDELEDAEG